MKRSRAVVVGCLLMCAASSWPGRAGQRDTDRPAPAPDPLTQPPPPPPIPPVPTIPTERLADGSIRAGLITLDPASRSLSFPAKVQLGNGVLEVIIATPVGRLHEALLVTEVSPLKLQALLYTLNLVNGPRGRDETGRQGDFLDIDLDYTDANGHRVREPIEAWIRDTRTGKSVRRIGWVFTGSVMRDGKFLAEEEGNICLNYSAGATIIDSPDPQSTDDTIHVVENAKAGPLKGLEVTVILSARPAPK